MPQSFNGRFCCANMRMDDLRCYQFLSRKKRIRIQKPAARPDESETLWEEVRAFSRLVPYAPDPNLGRVQEIKEEIRRGTYIQQHMIDETAARLAIRFLKGEQQADSGQSDESNPESVSEP